MTGWLALSGVAAFCAALAATAGAEARRVSGRPGLSAASMRGAGGVASVFAKARTNPTVRGPASPGPGALEAAALRLPFVASLARQAERAQASEDCVDQAPELFDILTLGLSAGLSFDASLDLYEERYGTELARRLEGAQALWRTGCTSRARALEDLAREVGAQPLRRFSAAVNEALEFGVPLAATLRRQADAIREEQRRSAEEAIERVPVKLLAPLGGLVVPAMLIAILGPLLSGAFAAG